MLDINRIHEYQIIAVWTSVCCTIMLLAAICTFVFSLLANKEDEFYISLTIFIPALIISFACFAASIKLYYDNKKRDRQYIVNFL